MQWAGTNRLLTEYLNFSPLSLLSHFIYFFLRSSDLISNFKNKFVKFEFISRIIDRYFFRENTHTHKHLVQNRLENRAKQSRIYKFSMIEYIALTVNQIWQAIIHHVTRISCITENYEWKSKCRHRIRSGCLTRAAWIFTLNLGVINYYCFLRLKLALSCPIKPLIPKLTDD